MELKDYVTTIPDFPKPGIMFRDITTVVSSPEGLKMSIDLMVDQLKNIDFDLVVDHACHCWFDFFASKAGL